MALWGVLALALAFAVTPGHGEVGSAAARPHAVKLLINGKSWPLDALNGGDDYVGIRSGRLRVEARWRTDARGTGYYVLISTAEPLGRTLARCLTGTSCLVPKRVPISVGQELTFTVKVLTTRRNKLVAGYKACLTGR